MRGHMRRILVNRRGGRNPPRLNPYRKMKRGLTAKEMQAVIGISESSFYAYIRNGMPCSNLRPGTGKRKKLVFDPQEVKNWMAANGKKPRGLQENGYTSAEVAHILGTSRKAVMQRMQGARSVTRETIANWITEDAQQEAQAKLDRLDNWKSHAGTAGTVPPPESTPKSPPSRQKPLDGSSHQTTPTHTFVMNTKKPIEIKVPFTMLHSVDDTYKLTQVDKTNPAGVTITMTQDEYSEILRIQARLAERRADGNHLLSCQHVGIRMDVGDVNFEQDNCPFRAKECMLEVDEFGVDLCLYNCGMLYTCVRAEITSLLREAFPGCKPAAASKDNPQPGQVI